ncbi:hypothetical protein HJA_01925 [Hyphomonas jannaschiana VP2]|uniref:Uncharacterized protein n=1 Tax=Hyphomonas jannaschiana VP2 TaxID=1280952 RepID=A0A059FKW6_9PROT|nr:hypothetical protein HJA_01925 [Hyphomonas jannaschiana VP2]
MRRCTACRYKQREALPNVDKKVIYLDQFALSELFLIKNDQRRPNLPYEDFWKEAFRLIERCVHLQQAIFPMSDVHSMETIVSRNPTELRLFTEMLGDAALVNSREVESAQIFQFAKAFMNDQGVPDLDFSVDEVLKRDRNVWLPDLHITVNADFSDLAEAIRDDRDAGYQSLAKLAERWAAERPSFEDVLEVELSSFGPVHKEAMVTASDTAARMSVFQLQRYFEHELIDCNTDQVLERLVSFLDWEGNRLLPHHKISSYLFAAIARKMAAGQKRAPNPGMLNDIRAISAYGPYVDAMFIDKECATFLSEAPLSEELGLSQRVYSLNTAEQFLELLRKTEATASPEVREYCAEIYAVE